MKKLSIKSVPVICILVTLAAAGIFLLVNNKIAISSTGIIYPRVYFSGEYKIGDGSWQEYRPGMHLSAARADVVLRGTLKKYLPGVKESVGTVGAEDVLAVYCNHLMVQLGEEGFEPTVLDVERSGYEVTCAKMWQYYRYQGNNGGRIEIRIHSPHSFGNENAVDELLENMYIYAAHDFEEDRVKEGSLQRTVGMTILLSACCILGISVFAGRIHIRGNRQLWMMALLMICAGGYLILSSANINLWRNSYTFNTVALGISMMLYQYLVTVLLVDLLGEKTRKAALVIVHLSGLLLPLLFIASMTEAIHFYGTWGIWAVAESLVSLFLAGCIWCDMTGTAEGRSWKRLAAAAPLLSFVADVAATAMGWWQGGKLSVLVFLICVLALFIIVIRILPQKINEAARTKELEEKQRELQQELKERRVSVMMSQIRTHFIFNILTIISGLCNSDPQKADDALILFASYLRKNMAVMERDDPILFSQELQHLEEYMYLEKMRFGEKIQFEKKLGITDFKIPPLTIQPLVENAVRHGLLAHGKKGTVTLSTVEEEGRIRILVEDDGAGFDLRELEKEEAVGIRNVRYRVENMVGGRLEVKSTPGKGTRAEIYLNRDYG